MARGEDPGIYTGDPGRHSVSAERTFARDIADQETLWRHTLLMGEEVYHRALEEEWMGHTIQVKYRFPPFETHSISRTLPRAVTGSDELSRLAFQFLEEKRDGRALRLLGVGIAGDRTTPVDQPELFSEGRERPLDPTIVALRRRFGDTAIGRASLSAVRNDASVNPVQGEESTAQPVRPDAPRNPDHGR